MGLEEERSLADRAPAVVVVEGEAGWVEVEGGGANGEPSMWSRLCGADVALGAVGAFRCEGVEAQAVHLGSSSLRHPARSTPVAPLPSVLHKASAGWAWEGTLAMCSGLTVVTQLEREAGVRL